MIIVPIKSSEEPAFRRTLVAYWRDLVPEAPFLQDVLLAETEFQGRFRWSGGSNNPFWGIIDDQPVGFFMYRICDDRVTSYIHDFYIAPFARRRGYGTEMYRKLRSHLLDRGISKINLSVISGNEAALRFWKDKAFQIKYHRLSTQNRLIRMTALVLYTYSSKMEI